MLKGDIKRYIYQRSEVHTNTAPSFNSDNLFSGQKIKKSEILNLPSIKLMNADELEMIDSILKSMHKNEGDEKGKKLIKQIDGIVPLVKTDEPIGFDYKDAA